ncbi:VOC family protein [Streptomyces sp. NPDC058086]|uniref:VOC family protein n=1 Tax=Streptomyces sp. NPDC058086 TaxID=3346334 RepID=UPI0036DFE4F3
MSTFYHVCFTTPDLAATMADLTRSAGLAWQPPVEGRLAEWDYRMAFTAGAPPFIELIETAPGGPWGDVRAPGFHHLGFWTSDLAAGSARLSSLGYQEAFSGCPFGRAFAYHRLDTIGGHIELVDITRQPSFQRSWNPGGQPMPAINESSAT